MCWNFEEKDQEIAKLKRESKDKDKEITKLKQEMNVKDEEAAKLNKELQSRVPASGPSLEDIIRRNSIGVRPSVTCYRPSDQLRGCRSYFSERIGIQTLRPDDHLVTGLPNDIPLTLYFRGEESQFDADHWWLVYADKLKIPIVYYEAKNPYGRLKVDDKRYPLPYKTNDHKALTTSEGWKFTAAELLGHGPTFAVIRIAEKRSSWF